MGVSLITLAKLLSALFHWVMAWKEMRGENSLMENMVTPMAQIDDPLSDSTKKRLAEDSKVK